MARKPKPIQHFLEYSALRAVSGFMQCFRVEQNLRTAEGVGSLFYRSNANRRRRACQNIHESFPNLSSGEAEAIAERSLQHMFQLFLVDSMVMPRLITPDSWSRYISIGDLGPVLDRMIQGKPTIMITGHCGNWELLGYYLALMGFPIAALARPLDNPYLNTWLMGIREARGMKIITKWGATTELISLLKNGGQVGFIADQNAGDQGLFVPFFGRLASSYKSIGLLAMRYDIPIVAGHARRVGGQFRYHLSCTDFIRPDDWTDQPDPLYYITARVNRAMETMIESAPEQYLWLHRRWKSRPKHEREGQPMPKRLVRKIEALPWLSTEQVRHIVDHSNTLAKNKVN
ncbi:MAG: lysophospholipid acyltransferase family protein [Planctomycetota bacterium]|nr:lysophospholipid acyltransferase family protein [Planctomycetota bacterium]